MNRERITLILFFTLFLAPVVASLLTGAPLFE